MEDISIKKIIESASGADEHGYPKAAVGLFHERINSEGECLETINTVSCKKPILNIFRNYNKIFIDFEFPTHLDVDLDMMNSILRDAFSSAQSIEDGTDEFSLITLSIVPEEFGGYYYMVATDPAFWALTAKTPRDEIRILRMVFEEDDFYIMQSSKESVEEIYHEAQAMADKEQRDREFLEQRSGEMLR